MATALPKLVTITLTYQQYAKIAAGTWTLPSGVMVDSVTDNNDGATLQVNFSGTALGTWAQPQPIAAHIEVSPQNVVNIEGIGSSSSSSSGS